MTQDNGHTAVGWHRADGDRQVMLYTLMQSGWRKGEPVMVNDVSVTFRQDNKSATDLEPHVAMFLAAPALLEALDSLVALMDRDAEANQTNYAEIVLEEPEVKAARAALLRALGSQQKGDR